MWRVGGCGFVFRLPLCVEWATGLLTPSIVKQVGKRVAHPTNCFQAALEPVFIICIGRFDDIKARIQGKKHSRVEHLASIFNAVAAFLGH